MQLFRDQRLLISLAVKAPRAIKKLLLSAIATGFFLVDADLCRSSVFPAIRRAFPQKSRLFCLFVALRATRTSLHYVVTAGELAVLPASVVEQTFKRRSSIDGLDHLESALQLGRGAVLASSHFSCFYISLFAEADRPLDVPTPRTMVTAQPPLEELEAIFFSKLQSLATSHKLERIELWKPRSGLDFLGAVRSRKVVACMVDNVNHGSGAVFAKFLGQTTAFPAGLFAVAAKCNAPILPVHVEWDSYVNKYRVVFGAAIVTSLTASLDTRTVVGAQAVADYFSNLVRQKPGTWESWRTLDYRQQIATTK
jgi:lauroyl/myristoyl acyltransferase